MDEQEITAELMRMAEQYKAEEGRRRVRMVAQPQDAGNAQAIAETPQSGPDLDEYAYVGAPSPPVTSQEQRFRPQLARDEVQGPYPPLRMPGIQDARAGPQVPAGYTYGDDQITRDPNGIPAVAQYPSPSQTAWDTLTAATPSIGSALAVGIPKAVGTGVKYAQTVRDLAKDYRGTIGKYLGEVGRGEPDRSVPELRNSHGGSFVSGMIEGATFPGDVYSGRDPIALPTDMTAEQGARVAGLAGLAMTGGIAGTGAGGVPIGAGPIRGGGKGGGKRGAITDINLREMPLDEALKVVESDPHLRKVNAKSDYVGAPEGVRGPKTLQAIRDNFDADVKAGAPGADWYIRAQGGIKEMAGPDPVRQSLLAREKALTSAQANPDANLGFALDMHNAYELGEPLAIARTGQTARTYNTTRDVSRQSPMMGHNQGPPLDDVPKIPLGKKTGIYGGHMDPTAVDPTTGTNDIWHARAWGYTKDGKPWSDALTPQQHAFLDAETVKAVGRMNEQAAGGRTDWTPGEVQAAPWVVGKARGLMKQRDLSYEEAVAEAIKSYPDYFNKYTFNQTYELTPGVMTGHRPDISGGTQELKRAYADNPRTQWTDANQRDVINDALGLYQRPTQRATGLYTPPGGQPEVNPGFVARPMVGLKSGGEGVKPRDLVAMEKAQAFRAYMDAQGAGAGSMPIQHAPAGQMGSVFVPSGGTPRTVEELAQLQALGKPRGVGEVIDYGPGGTVMTGFPPPSGAQMGKNLKTGLAEDIKNVAPGSRPNRTKLETVYAGYEDLWGTQSGAVTEAMFKHLDKPEAPAVLARLDQDPKVRQRVLEKMRVDAESGAPVNEAVQNAREIYARGGLVGLRKALKDGRVALPAVALAVPGLFPQEQQGD